MQCDKKKPTDTVEENAYTFLPTINCIRPARQKRIEFLGQIISIKPKTIRTEYLYKCSECGQEDEQQKYSKDQKHGEECKGKWQLKTIIEDSGFEILIVDNIRELEQTISTLKLFISQRLLEDSEGNTDKTIPQFIAQNSSLTRFKGKIRKSYSGRRDEGIDYFVFVDEFERVTTDDFKPTVDQFKKLQDFFANKKWNLEDVDNFYLPNMAGRELAKKSLILLTLTPAKILESKWSTGVIMFFGDGGENKSIGAKNHVTKYLKNLPAMVISAELTTSIGLMAGIKKEKDGSWIIERGVFSQLHKGFIVNDGVHQWSKEQISKLREVMSQKEIRLVKIEKAQLQCAIRMLNITNCRYQIEHYATPYHASFDIGTGEDDQANKNSGPDRRRIEAIIPFDSRDVTLADVSKLKKLEYSKAEKDKLKFYAKEWNLLFKLAFSLTPDKIRLTNYEKTYGAIDTKLLEWNLKYPKIELAILTKEGPEIFLKYVVASAILHFRFNKDLILEIKNEDVDYISKWFEEQFQALKIDEVIERDDVLEAHARGLFKDLTERHKNTLVLIHQYGNIKRASDSGKTNRMAIYRLFNQPIIYGYERRDSKDQVLEFEKEQVYFGAIGRVIDQMDRIWDGVVPPLWKAGGGLTDFGLKIIRMIREGGQKI